MRPTTGKLACLITCLGLGLAAGGPAVSAKEEATKESKDSISYRKQMNSEGSPSETVAAGYKWAPGSELKLRVA